MRYYKVRLEREGLIQHALVWAESLEQAKEKALEQLGFTGLFTGLVKIIEVKKADYDD